MIVRLAEKSELVRVFALYKAALNRPGCPWNEEYPDEFWLNKDYETKNLYVLADEGKIIGAASVVYENELNDEAEWKYTCGAREIARVVVSEEYAGRGLAVKMLSEVFEKMRSAGAEAVHLSVADTNPAAVRTYEKLGFKAVGEGDMYGSHFIFMEKPLKA